MSDDARVNEGPSTPGEITPEVFVAAQESEDFVKLRKTFRAFAFPMTAAFLIWYFAYVLLVLLVAVSRLYLGYHFVTDVLAGASLATAVLGVVVVVDRRFGPAPRSPG